MAAVVLLNVMQGMSQSMDDIFAKYMNETDAKYVEVPGNMLEQMASQNAEEEPEDKSDAYNTDSLLEAEPEDITTIRALSTESKSLAKKIRKSVNKLEGYGYEVLLRINDSEKLAKIFTCTKEGKIRELVVMAEKGNSFALIQVCGNLNTVDTEKLANFSN